MEVHMKIKAIFFLLLFVIANTLFFFSSAFGQGDPSSTSIMRLEKGWEYKWVDSVESDTGIPEDGWLQTENVKELNEPRNDSDILYLRNVFPGGDWKDPAIFISFMYGTFEVYQGDQLIYQYGDIPEGKTVTYKGYIHRHFIELDKDNTSNIITIRSYSNGNLIGVAGAVSVGSHSAYLNQMFTEDFDKIVIGSILLFLTIIGLIFFIAKRFEAIYFTFAAMSFCAALYTFSITGSKQLIIDFPYLWIYVFQIAVFFRSAFDLIIIDQLFGPGKKKWIRRLWQIHLLLAIVAFILSMINPDYFTLTKGIFEKLSGIEVLLILGIVIRVFLRNVEAKIYAIGFLAMAGFMVRDLLVFTGVIYLDRFYLLGHIGQFILVLAIGVILMLKERNRGRGFRIQW